MGDIPASYVSLPEGTYRTYLQFFPGHVNPRPSMGRLYIYLHLPYKSTIHVGKYTSPMHAMGMRPSPKSSPLLGLPTRHPSLLAPAIQCKAQGAFVFAGLFKKQATSQANI